MSRQISELQEGLAQVEARRETVIRAPDGRRGDQHRRERAGSRSPPTRTLATVLPKGSGLHVELLVPTRAIGFVQKGQEVVLRYEAFPHERFGQYRGTITDIGRNVWTAGRAHRPALGEGARLSRGREARAARTSPRSGQDFPLRPGMLVNADLLLEKRTLLEWIFEPVLQLKGRL